jgi:membrane-bound lytic murein transglycosylase B
MRNTFHTPPLHFFFCLLFVLCPQHSCAAKTLSAANCVKDGQRIDLQQQKYTTLFSELTQNHGFTQEELNKLFQNVSVKRRVLVLMDKQWESKPYYQYRPLFITDKVIKTAKAKLREYKLILDRIEQELGVDREAVIAIWGVESRFGKYSGGFNVFQTLNTLFSAYPRRSEFFGKELLHFLVLCKENNYDPLSIEGSYAGAFGQTQFIPSSFREYAISFDGDKRRDVFNSVPDILASIANYLHFHHWSLNTPYYMDIGSKLRGKTAKAAEKKGRKGGIEYTVLAQEQNIALPPPPGSSLVTIVGLEIDPAKGGGKRYIAGYPNFQAITEWNHSNRYAMVVSELAAAIQK